MGPASTEEKLQDEINRTTVERWGQCRGLKMGAVEPEVVTSTPDVITRAIGVRPIYRVQPVGGSGLSAARWRFENLPPTREALPQSVLAYCAAGSACVTKVIGGRTVHKWPKVGSVTFEPGERPSATWWVDGTVEAIHVYLRQAAVQHFAEQHLDAASAPEIDDFFAIQDPWLAGSFQMLISELETFTGVDGMPSRSCSPRPSTCSSGISCDGARTRRRASCAPSTSRAG